MAIAVNPNKVSRYIVKSERTLPREQRTVYLYRPRTIACARDVATALKDETHTHAAIVLLRHCLTGWENLLTEDGKPADFKRDQAGMATEETIARIPDGDRDELAGAILAGSVIDEGTLGN